MAAEELAESLLESEQLNKALQLIALESILRDLPSLDLGELSEPPDWSFALTCASLLSQVRAEYAQDAALRIAQGCIASNRSEPHEREGAAVLLERMGNRLALRLAGQRTDIADVNEETWAATPGPLQLDVIRRRLELTIPVSGQQEVAGNPFQRRLWGALKDSRWVSASAPTSAGKSFIVKRWFEEQLARIESFHGVYLVPTRALIEEVSRELRRELPDAVGVYSIPWDKALGTTLHEVHVLTQERLHFLHQLKHDFVADLLFIDEAQKFGDLQRGVLLQRVLTDSLARNPELQVVFASPMAENPELLLEGAPKECAAITSETVTVNQNLLWVNQVPRKPLLWTASLIKGDHEIEAGTLTLPARPVSTSKRLSYVALALGRETSGNVVYVNGAAAAEKTAGQIADALGPAADISERDEITALRELVEHTIHRSYALVSVLNRGVAFHYGNMPLLVRREIEDLFRAGVLRYLVCTSTLLEGVNLPCRNIFARAPKKGSVPMSSADFWNLAGRAGRWGKEFEGNIICVDTLRPDVWAEPPRRRSRSALTRVTESVFQDLGSLREYVDANAPVDGFEGRELKEDVFSFLAAQISSGKSLAGLPGISDQNPQAIEALEAAVSRSLEAVELPAAIVQRHAGISPPAMQRLLEYIRGHADQDAMLLASPESEDAALNYKRALGRCDSQLGSDFGSGRRQFQLAILIVSWMKGMPLARLISKRIEINSDRGDKNVARDIRATMKDVDEVARFAAPKYLACYLDVLKFHLVQTDREAEVEFLPDITMMLELGVARTTEVSMMALGLSRASAVALEEQIADDDLTPEQCVEWLQRANLEAYGLPRLVEREILEVLDNKTN